MMYGIHSKSSEELSKGDKLVTRERENRSCAAVIKLREDRASSAII